MRPLLITRAEEEARTLAARIGPHAVIAPCLAWEWVDTPRPEVQGADVLVTSARGAAALARIGADPTWRVLALAPTTAAAARAAGLRVDVEVGGGAADLARAARPDAPLVCATSDLGGAEVRTVRPDAVVWVVYRTICPEAVPNVAKAAMKEPFDVLFTSPSAVEHFERLAPGALLRAHTVYFHGRTTRDAVAARGRTAVPFDINEPSSPAPTRRGRGATQ